MGALAPKRFKDKYLASSGLYQGLDYETIANKKIKDKRPFTLGAKDTGQKVYGLRLIRDKDSFILEYTNSKTSKRIVGKKSVGGVFKDPDFGGGKGTAGGSDDTAITESLQCYFLSILFNTSATKLDNKNTQLEHLQKQH